jgi:hypothetical protein
MEKRRKNQNSLDQDLEFAADGLPEEGVKKDSRFFHYSAFAGFLVLVGLVFFSSSASTPIRQQYGKTAVVDLIDKAPDAVINTDRVTVADIGTVANAVSADSKGVNKISDMISLNKKCLVRY